MMSQFCLKKWVFSLFLLFGLAQKASSNELKKSPLNYSLFSKLETDFKELSQNDKIFNLVFGASLHYRLSKKSSLGLSIPFLKSLSGERKFDYLDGNINHNYQIFENKKGLSLNLYTGFTLLIARLLEKSVFFKQK